MLPNMVTCKQQVHGYTVWVNQMTRLLSIARSNRLVAHLSETASETRYIVVLAGTLDTKRYGPGEYSNVCTVL